MFKKIDGEANLVRDDKGVVLNINMNEGEKARERKRVRKQKDKEKEEEERRQQLRKEWTERQEAMKNETLEITYSYWDGSGHRKKIQMKKLPKLIKKVNLIIVSFHKNEFYIIYLNSN